MSKRVKLAIAVALVTFVAVVFVVTRGPMAPNAIAPGSFAFAVLGDSPHYLWEELQFSIVRQDLDAHELSWVVHVGDIF